ncbi:siderophore ferric iron reductase [Paraburkholderia acidiphila]|uniref:Siderophore ferric iron reductase n=1 Tax=Paraburkholderia acidiphila TaxID=2571747 RepID=A0A7Z2GD98_9BURK|nr:siderophore ferric iron reductase [Paraburkholderia acidiphila]QGZ59410.1 siderophore ferric iron reductase [Paraburkholderia acidiphila]
MAANRALDDMLRLAARLVPGLRGVVAARPAQGLVHTRPAPQGGESNRAALEAMLDYWSRTYPEAGRPYWSLRCWGILIWQPLYLSVIGVHASRVSLSLRDIAQPIADGWTHAVHLRDHEPAQDDTHALIAHAAREIASCSEQMQDELMPVIRLNPASVRGTQADVVLAALLAARKARPEWSDAQVEEHGRQWLAALGLQGHSGYFAFSRTDGARALALERRTCCYHYRRRDGELCSTCPRLDKHERIVRLNAQHETG